LLKVKREKVLFIAEFISAFYAPMTENHPRLSAKLLNGIITRNEKNLDRLITDNAFLS